MRRSGENCPALPPHRPWRRHSMRRSPRNSEGRAAILFLLPSLLGTAVFVLVPFAETVRRSFCDALGKKFVGFANYRSVLENTAFRLAAQNTVRFLCTCVPILLLCSLLLALGVQAVAKHRSGSDTRRGKVFRTTFLLPMAIPVASIVILWKVLFARNGLVNGVLSALGGQAVDFMGTEAAFWVLVFTYVWKNAGYDMILWLAGLDSISADLYEAASVDGANAGQKFFYITLPNLLPTLTLVSVLSLLNSFKAFREAFLVGGNYPHQSMYLLQHLFNNWFLSLDLPRLTAAAVLMALALSGLILALQRMWTWEKAFPQRRTFHECIFCFCDCHRRLCIPSDGLRRRFRQRFFRCAGHSALGKHGSAGSHADGRPHTGSHGRPGSRRNSHGHAGSDAAGGSHLRGGRNSF